MAKLEQLSFDIDEIAATKLEFPNFVGFNKEEFPSYPGKEHYKLLSYLVSNFSNGTIIDIGTHTGSSAYALSLNKSNVVHSFDIVAKIDPRLKRIPNIQFHIENLWDDETRAKWKDTILNSQLIVLDIDPHEGKMEYEFYCFLRDNNYQGVVIADDIWYFKGMRDNFWYHIPHRYKRDLTKSGHWSGTGLISFCLDNSKREDKNWTFVTGYFDLTKCEDASDAIRSRPADFYLHSANTTMGIDANLVVFCEPKFQPMLEVLRPDHLKHRTKYILCEFDDFPLNKYRDKINENRKTVPSADPRNTASYYLFCMARYEMLKRMIIENPFNSTHFGWINICIERYGYRNVAALEDVMGEYRDKFSTCYIDYISEELVANLPEYFKWGRCSLCSGFFTGNGEYMLKFCNLIEKQFMEYLERGYGHADEQLYSPIFFKHPEIFEVYYADYRSMVTNYVKIVEDVHSVIRHFITNSFNNKKYSLAYPGCLAVWKYCTETAPDQNRNYYDPRNTSILKEWRSQFLKILLVCAREMGDSDMVVKALTELMCMQLGY